MIDIALLIASSIATFGFGKILDKGYDGLFKNKKDFQNRLYKVICNTLEKFQNNNPLILEAGKSPFYEFKIFVEKLLNWRLFKDETQFDVEQIIDELKTNKHIQIPQSSEIEAFLNVFIENIKKDQKLKKTFCDEFAHEETFKNSKKLDEVLNILKGTIESESRESNKTHKHPQLKILSITASPKEEDIFCEKEQEAILDAFHKYDHKRLFVDIPDLIESTMYEIAKYLKDGKHDVLQITAHGSIDENGEGYLVFEEPDEKKKGFKNINIYGTDLAELLKNLKENNEVNIQLVILSSCYSGNDNEAYNSVAKSLSAAGIPNVIGMKKTVSHDASIVFNTNLFNALLDGNNIQEAFEKGKSGIADLENDRRLKNPKLIFESEIDIPILYTNQPEITIDDFSKHEIISESRVHLRQFKTNTVTRGFIGRRKQIREILKRIQEKQTAIVLKGPSGIGKSTLTARILIDLLRDDYIYLEFQGKITPAEILEKLTAESAKLHSLKIAEIKTAMDFITDIKEKLIYLYNSYFSQKKIVIVFDNFEDNQDLKNDNNINKELRAFIKKMQTLFSGSDSVIIFSTRYNLPGFEANTLNVPEYTPLEIQKKIYFSKSLKKLDEKSLKQINDTVARNPRSLDLMNSLIETKFQNVEIVNLTDIAGLAVKLKEILRTGANPTDGDDFAPFILEKLLELLSQEQFDLLKVVSTYRRPVGFEAISFYALPVIESDLESLEKLSLIEIIQIEQQNFYYTHRLTASYFRETLENEEIIELNDKAAKYCLTVFEKDRTIESYLEVREHLLRAEKYDEAASIAFSAGLALSRWGDVFAALKLNLDTLETNISKKNIGNAKSNIGRIYSALGESQKALKYHQEALAINQQINHKKGEANQLGSIGTIHYILGELQKALKYHQKALEIDRQLNYKQGETADLGDIGNIFSKLGDTQKALKYYQDSLEINQQLNYKQGEASQLGNIGLIYKDIGEPLKALKYHQEALEINQQLNYKEGEAADLGDIGNIYSIHGDTQKALKYYQESLEISRQFNLKQVEANQLGNIGLIYYTLNEPQKVIEYLIPSMLIFLNIESQEIKVNIDILKNLIMKIGFGQFEKYVNELGYKYEEIKTIIDQNYHDQSNDQTEQLNQQLVEHSVKAIKTHRKEEDHFVELEELRKNPTANTHPDIIKYYDFLIEHAKGKKAEEIKDTIDKPLWDMFVQIRDKIPE